jgi:hypothetical protein
MPNPFRFPPEYATFPVAFTGTKLLDGRIYRFRVLPNARANQGRGAFYVDLFNVLAQPVIYGVKLVLTDDLYASIRATVTDVPPGRIVIRRTDGLASDPAIFDLTVPTSPTRLQTFGSENVVMEYVSLAEIEAAQGVQLQAAT